MQDATFWGFLGVMLTVASSVWAMSAWLNGHFNLIRKEITGLGKDILDKLEYHERHDDSRFAQVQDAVTNLRVNAAASDALLVLREAKKIS